MMCYDNRDRKQYFIEYNIKRKKIRQDAKSFTLHLPGIRESSDVWNMQRKKSNFQYDEIYINFLRKSFPKDKNVNTTRKINIRKNTI